MNGSDMSLSKDPAFKLFGRKIPVPDPKIPANPESKDRCSEVKNIETEGVKGENFVEPKKSHVKEENGTPIQVMEAPATSKPKEDQIEVHGNDQDKVFKKPDKVLPCPRCNSLDTKFCYFNNYNVNQPRHFCKNCQRYWTAGGTMRNVPIGAGRRKNKHLASPYRQILVSSDGMPITAVENSDLAKNQLISSADSAKSSTRNGVVLKFGPEAPLCDSMETVLNLGDQKRFVEMISVDCRENGEKPSSCASSMIASTVQANELHEMVVQKEQVGLPGPSKEQSVPHPLHCYPVPPCVFPWNPSWNNVASTASVQHSGQVCLPNNNHPNQVQWCPTTVLAVPGFCPPNIPIQFMPSSYWGCIPIFAAEAGKLSPCGSNGFLSQSSGPICSSGNGSLTLGKHSRESNLMDEEKTEKCVLVPKKLRIDDPNEASKSPLWASLGLKLDQKNPISKGAIFKTFQTKEEENGHASEATCVLEANPAALSRSNTFQESG